MLQAIQSFFIKYGLFGLFFGSFVGSLIFFPAPLEIMTISVVAMGSDPIKVAIFMSLGSIIGGIFNYYLGFFGSKVMLKESDLRKVEKLINKWGDPVVFVTSLIPFPFDVVAVAVGILRMRFKDFLIACSLGKIIKFFFFALVGSLIWKYFGIKLFSNF